VGVPVDLIITMDPVDEKVVPKNVKLCINYWQPGIFGDSNFLRGIPLSQEPGGSGKVVNINLFEEGRELREATTNHINIDEAPKLHKAIVDHVLATCPKRAAWVAMHPTDRVVSPLTITNASDETVRTAAAKLDRTAAKPVTK
jgi:hypothetical protein